MASFFMKDKEELNLNATFDNLIQQATTIQDLCKDDVIPVKDLHMTDDLKLNGMDLSDLAVGHLCGKLQVPSRYFNRLVDCHMNELAAENINVWFDDKDKRSFMLRQYDGHIRGVLSGSYSKYDAPEILGSVKEVFGDGRFIVKGSFINEERLHVRFVDKNMLPIDGEDLFAGITIDSSDVGRSGLAANFFIYKKVCTNGLVVSKSSAKLFTQKHIGITHEDFKKSLEDGLQSFDDVKDSVIASIQNTKKIPLPEDLEEITEKVKAMTKLSDDDIEEVFNLTVTNYEPTTWGLINGITEIAQKFGLERRLELETVASQMLV